MKPTDVQRCAVRVGGRCKMDSPIK